MYQRRPFLVTMVLAMLVLGLIWGCASDDEDDPNAPPAGPCNLSLVDPVGSETYFSGTLQYILWDSENGGDLVKIELFKFQDQYDTTFMDTTIVSIDTTVVDTTIFVIEDATDNDGSTSWTVTTNGAQSDSNYSIKLTSLTDQGCVARSDTFLIIKTEDCEVFVLVPQDDDLWVVGDSELIQWESEDTGGTVNIDLYKLVEGQSAPFYNIATAVPDTGGYAWKVFACHAGGSTPDYQIRVADATNTNCRGFSDFFTIEDLTPCIIQVDTPAEDEVLTVGDQFAIQWHGADPDDDVDIFLKRPGLSDATIATGIANSDHEYLWTVDLLGGNAGTGFNIYIQVSDDPCCSGQSAEFEIEL